MPNTQLNLVAAPARKATEIQRSGTASSEGGRKRCPALSRRAGSARELRPRDPRGRRARQPRYRPAVAGCRVGRLVLAPGGRARQADGTGEAKAQRKGSAASRSDACSSAGRKARAVHRAAAAGPPASRDAGLAAAALFNLIHAGPPAACSSGSGMPDETTWPRASRRGERVA